MWLAVWSLRWLVIAAAVTLLGILVGRIWTVLLPVLLALVATSVLLPPAAFLERRCKVPAALSATIVLVGAVALVVLIGSLLAPSVLGQSADIAADASRGLQRVQEWIGRTDLITQQQVETASQAAQDRLTNSASSIASGVLVGVNAVTSAVITIFITLVLVFFFLKDGRRFLPWVAKAAGPDAAPHLTEVMRRAWFALGGFVRTQALVSLIDAVVIGAALLIVGVPLAVPLAVLTFAGGFIPIVGAFVVGAIAVLVALVSNGVTGALIILAVIVAVQQLEGNVLSPWLQSRSTKLHAVVVLLSVALGSALFGIVGAFLAVPTAAVTAVVLRYIDEAARGAAVEQLTQSTPE